MRKVLAGLTVLAALGLAGCGGDGGGGTTASQAAATCWTPEFAANPTNPDGTPLKWATDPSPTHRHGKGPVGSNVCEP